MKLTLLDYADEKKTFDIGNLENIDCIAIEVITGDEIAYVFYKNGNVKQFASNRAIYDFYDGIYVIYTATSEEFLLDNPAWLNRGTSYDWLDYWK